MLESCQEAGVGEVEGSTVLRLRFVSLGGEAKGEWERLRVERGESRRPGAMVAEQVYWASLGEVGEGEQAEWWSKRMKRQAVRGSFCRFQTPRQIRQIRC